MPASPFDATFETLKHRVLTIGAACGAGWGTCAALGVLLGAIGVDLVWDLSAGARIVAIVCGLAAGAFLLATFARAALQKTRDILLARRLDEIGATGGEIVTGYELQSAQKGAAPSAGLTRGLADLAVNRATRIATEIPVALAAPARPFRRSAYCLTALAVCVLIVAIVSPRLAATELLRFFDPFGDHPPFSHTHIQVEPGDAQVRYGDGLEVLVTTSGPPVEELDLMLRFDAGDKISFKEEILPLFSEGVGKWRASVTSVQASGTYYVKARTTRSHRFKLECQTVPELEQVRFRVIPPAYTRSAVYEGPLPEKGLAGLVGTVVEVRARSNRPLSAGAIELVGEDSRETVRLEPASSTEPTREVFGSWTITWPGTFHLTVTDVAGQDSRESFSGSISLLQDQVPFVRLLEPIAQSLATPTINLPVVIAAEDDYGVTSVQLFRSLNGSRAIPLNLPVSNPPERKHEFSITLPLPDYGVQPGDVIKLFARVEDNDPTGAKGSESPVAVVQIIADEELERLLRTREGTDLLLSKYQEAQRRLESLNEELEQLKKQLEKRDPEGALSEEEKESLEKLADRMADEADAVRKSAEHALSYDIDQSLNDELQQLSKRMQEAAEETRQAASPDPKAGPTAKKLAEVQEKLADERKELQEGVNDPLDKLAEIYPLYEDQARFVELARQQRDLAERLQSLKEQDNPDDPAAKSRMRDLEAEQRRNREDLDRLLNDIGAHAAKLPDDDPKLAELAESSREFVSAVRESAAGQSMSDAESGLSEFSGKRGHAGADHAADILESFLSKCNGMGEGAGAACQSLKFKPGEGCLGNTLEQMLADAGLKPGSGSKPGQSGMMGAGGGFSARRSTLNNIGMYGRIPAKGNPKSTRAGGGERAQTVGGSYRANEGPATSSKLDPHGLWRASGASEASVPARYRGRVERYFQRIADEAGSRK
ncbi:MAG: hypothetical protein HY290_08785 [Planctomycetia bacterium]|nr:hypothetical protein [Planctomycetia bacterium]